MLPAIKYEIALPINHINFVKVNPCNNINGQRALFVDL